MRMGQRRRGLIWGAVSLLGLSGCNSPLIILDVTYGSGEQQLQLQAQLAGGAMQNPPILGAPSRLAIALPAAASGPVQINLFGQDAHGCQISRAALNLELPGGLSHATEQQVMMAPLSGPASKPTFTCSPDGWCQCVPPAQPAGLQAVIGFTGMDAIAVGQQGAITRCSGASCTPLTFQAPPELLAVWGNSEGSFYAVGDPSTVIRCDATTRSCTTLISGTPWDLNAVAGSGADNVYAAGQKATVIRCGESSDSCTTLPSGLPSTTTLYTVWASDENNVYAAGSAGAVVRCGKSSPSCQPLMPQWTMSDLHSAWGSGGTVYLAGDVGSLGACTAGALGCTKIDAKTLVNLRSLSGSGASLYAVGDLGVLVACNVTSAGAVTCMPIPTGTKATLRSVWASPTGNVFAVGDGGTLVSCAGGACSAQIVSTQNLLSVWGSDASHVYAVGDAGVVMYKAQ